MNILAIAMLCSIWTDLENKKDCLDYYVNCYNKTYTQYLKDFHKHPTEENRNNFIAECELVKRN
jgi:hypothetical protein